MEMDPVQGMNFPHQEGKNISEKGKNVSDY